MNAKLAGGYRPDIDGLRAIAVCAVVLFHAAPELLASGFVGVDIFFVISGYLIGGIIYAGASSGTFSFTEFYARRAKRIVPALVSLIAFVAVIGFFFFDRAEMHGFASQALTALLGVSNFYFWQHTGYFDTNSEVQPLLMTWSLGVEEQFYLLFPFAMFLIVRLDPRWRLASMVVLTAVSFAISAHLTDANPAAAFYLLPSRAWELGAGAVLAIMHHDVPHTRQASGPMIEIAAFGALAAMAISTVAFGNDTPFPGFAALLPVLATCALIQTQHSRVNRWLLASRPFVGVGLISYSFYLWHWPMMALVRLSADSAPGTATMLAIAALSGGAGYLSWRFVEQPFRHSRKAPGPLLARYGATLAAACAVPLSLWLADPAIRPLPASLRAVEDTRRGGDFEKCLVGLGSENLLRGLPCHAPDASIALIGDSQAWAYAQGLSDAAATQGARIALHAKALCLPLPGFTIVRANRPGHDPECARYVERTLTFLERDPAIKVVVVAGGWPRLDARDYHRFGTAGTGEQVPAMLVLSEGIDNVVKRLEAAGKKVTIIGIAPWLTFTPAEHITSEAMPVRRRLGRLIDGDRRVPTGYFTSDHMEAGREATHRWLAETMRARPQILFLDPRLDLCKEGRCPYVNGDSPIYFDHSHLAVAGSRKIDWSPVLSQLR